MEIGRNPLFPSDKSSSKRIITDEDEVSGDEEIPNLPEETLVEILARLPVQSLLKFRCVSKSWRSLISNPSFVKSHLDIATKDSTCSRCRIILAISDRGFNMKQFSVGSVVYELSIDALDVDYPIRQPHRTVLVVGTSNGLICLAINEKELYLWNPSTSFSTKLPPVEVNMNPGLFNIFGFGYSESADDYKILGIFCVFGIDGMYESLVKMYSLKANAWKAIEGFNNSVPLDDSGKLVNGKLHFATASGLGMDFGWDMVSIDLDSGAYGIVEQPDYGEGQFDFSLGVLRGCICILGNVRNSHVDLWVLKEYGVKESWTKLVTIPYVEDVPERFLYLKPLFMLPSEELLLVYGVHLAIYNPKANSLRYLQMHNLRSFLDADAYVESLVSPAVNES